MKPYKIKYSITPGAFTKEQLVPDGGCDQLLACSYIEGDDGSGSYCWVSSNGDLPHAPMADYRKLHCMITLAKELSESKTLNPSSSAFCRRVFEALRESVRRNKET